MATVSLFANGVQAQTWNLASDFSLSPNQANPNPDSYGNTNVWHFMESSTLAHDPSTYTLLPEFLTDAHFFPGLQQWQGSVVSTSVKDKLPFVGINTTGMTQYPLNIVWPAGMVRVHPNPTQLVVVGWQSPVTGFFDVSLGVSDLDASCGNGVLWFVDRGVSNLARGSIPNNGGSQNTNLTNIQMSQAEFLYVIVDPSMSNHGCDSTGLDVTITLSSLPVTIDIKPGSFPNSINLGSNGTVPVAILSSATFDATTIDPTTVTLASAPVAFKGKGTMMASSEDVNSDGLMDFVVHVSTQALTLNQSDTQATLGGKTYGGQTVVGEDSVRIVH